MATGSIALAQTTYKAPTETFPLFLQGEQSLDCNGATLRGSGGVNNTTILVDNTSAAKTNGGAGINTTGSFSTSGVSIHGFPEAVKIQTGTPAPTVLLSNNRFEANATDIDCNAPMPTATGTGNVRIGQALVCSTCTNCPF